MRRFRIDAASIDFCFRARKNERWRLGGYSQKSAGRESGRMSNPAELDLVRKALTDGLDGCVEWDVTVFERVEAELALHGLALRRIRNALIQFIRSGGDVVQVK